MKKITLFLFLSVLTSATSNAAMVELLSLIPDSEPTKVAHLGIKTLANNNISEFYYISPDRKTINSFSISALIKDQVLFKKKGYSLVYVKKVSYTAKQLIINLTYVKNVFDDDAGNGQRTFKIQFNSSLNKYEIRDEKDHVFTSAYINTHHNSWGMPAGIESVQVQ